MHRSSPTPQSLLRRQWALAWGLGLIGLLPFRPAPAQGPDVTLTGRTADGQVFDLATHRGQVVLVMLWSTGCAVCRDKMPELRQNVAGWHGRPFLLVLVSTDPSRRDVDDYERIVTRALPADRQIVRLWAGERGHRDNLGRPAVLPATWLIDKSGRVVSRFSGRVPAEAWDQVADLL